MDDNDRIKTLEDKISKLEAVVRTLVSQSQQSQRRIAQTNEASRRAHNNIEQIRRKVDAILSNRE